MNASRNNTANRNHLGTAGAVTVHHDVADCACPVVVTQLIALAENKGVLVRRQVFCPTHVIQRHGTPVQDEGMRTRVQVAQSERRVPRQQLQLPQQAPHNLLRDNSDCCTVLRSNAKEHIALFVVASKRHPSGGKSQRPVTHNQKFAPRGVPGHDEHEQGVER